MIYDLLCNDNNDIISKKFEFENRTSEFVGNVDEILVIFNNIAIPIRELIVTSNIYVYNISSIYVINT